MIDAAYHRTLDLLTLRKGEVEKLAKELLDKTEADGIGIGQGALGRPWIFEECKIKKSKIKIKEDIDKVIIKHARLVERLKGEEGMIEFRKHLCWYVRGLPGAKELRQEFVKVNNLADINKNLK